MTQTVALVGSTGSIGTQAVDVIAAEPDRYRVLALGAATSIDALGAQAHRLRPEVVAIADAELAPKLEELVPAGTEVLAGTDALAAISRDADVVLNAVVGFAGLPVTMAALEAGRRLALANKESLIAGGPGVQKARSTPGADCASEASSAAMSRRPCSDSAINFVMSPRWRALATSWFSSYSRKRMTTRRAFSSS